MSGLLGSIPGDLEEIHKMAGKGVGLTMLEKEIEAHLRDSVRSLGGLCLKFVTPGFTGVPDRLVLLPGGNLCFVETKRPGQRERQRQSFVQRMLRKLGFTVFSSVDGWARVDDVLAWCAARVIEVKGGDVQ